ncbi:MAG: hypothetical protein MPL62_14930 [Alphaproteobacteria bacterium]|nr:hypothetical protein [Alphaproteobacteria bacterium]
MEPGRKEEDTETYESRTTAAICIMQRKLPGYVVETFIAAGYDTLEAIANMNISNEAGNSLQLIEEYINSTHPNDPKFMRSNVTASMFRFPPGHRQTIESFVKEIKQLEDEKTRRARKRATEATTGPKAKLHKETPTYSGDSTSSVDAAPSTHASTLAYIRQQLVKWQRSQKDSRLNALKEYEQYEVQVQANEVDNMFATSVLCKVCNRSYALGQKAGRVMISNWTKHISKCIETSKCHRGVTRTIRDYLHASEAQTCSLSSKANATASATTPSSHPSPPLVQESNLVLEDEQHFRLSPPT